MILIDPRLIRLLTESLAHFQGEYFLYKLEKIIKIFISIDSDSSGRLDDSSESEDK